MENRREISLVEEGFRFIFDSENIAGIIINSSYEIQEVSNGCVKRFHLSPEKLLIDSLFDIFNNPRLEELIHSHVYGRRRSSRQLVPIHVARTVSWNDVEIFSLGAKEEPYYLLLFHDCTECYQLQTVLETLLTMSTEFFLFFDQKNRILHCSECAARLFGFSGQVEALGVHYSTFLYEKIKSSTVNEAFLAARERRSYNADVEFTWSGKTKRYELQVLSVCIKSEWIGTVLYFSPKNMEEKITEEEFLSEGQRQLVEEKYEFSVLAEDQKTFDTFKDYEQELKRLEENLYQYAYIEINDLIERLIMIAGEADGQILQQVQNYVGEFEYERAIKEFLKMDRGEA